MPNAKEIGGKGAREEPQEEPRKIFQDDMWVMPDSGSC